ncbi:MAG: hypothetical protein VX519_06460 [Myxococcota bacterium]|nr:hypothetical protein [Myxococcota bacterium]
MKTHCMLLLSAGLLAGCLPEPESRTNLQTVLFVMDNSASMTDEAGALGLNFTRFVEGLSAHEGLDYQLAITTPDIQGAAGALVFTDGVDIIQKPDDNVANQFNKSLLCNTACWDVSHNSMPSDPEYECNAEDPTIPEAVSFEYLDCVCGNDAWQSGAACAASGDEEGLEAALLAMCRAVEDPPPDCFDEIYSPLTDADVGTNSGLLREGDTLNIVVVSDEGDQSRRLESQDADPTPYLALLDQFNVRYRIAVIGPPYACETDDEGRETCQLTCNSGGATTWGTERYQAAAEATGGFFNPIAEEGSDGMCQSSDFSEHLDDLTDMVLKALTVLEERDVEEGGRLLPFGFCDCWVCSSRACSTESRLR